MKRTASILTFAAALFAAASASAAWRMVIESPTAQPGQTGVSLDIMYYFELPLAYAALPVVVRSLDPGAFWTGTLPHDTLDGEGNRYRAGVTWHPSVEPWALMVLELRPGPLFWPEESCGTDADTNRYNGISPDYFLINTMSFDRLAAQPDGMTFVTLEFNVTDTPGQFEFDTACLAPSVSTIIMIDGVNYVDYGPLGLNLVDFDKGVVTISAPCDCSTHDDVNADGPVNAADVVIMVNHVYKNIDARVPSPNCPVEAGDVDCDGAVNAADVVLFINYVYKNITPFPCAPCGP